MLKKKLVFKITFGYSLIILISLLIVGLLFINLFREYSFQNKQDNLASRAREIAKVSEQYLAQGGTSLTEYKGFLELLDSFVNSRVWITDSEGNILVSSEGKFKDEKGSVEEITRENSSIQKVLSGQEVFFEGQGLFYNEPMITVGVPVINPDNKVIGTVFLHSPVTGITATIDTAFLILIIGIFLALLLSVMMGVFYSSFVTKPLKLMNNAAMEMTRGNYQVKTDIRQKDEIGQLGSSLDLLSSKLEYTIDQLFQEKGKLNDILSSISEGIVAFDSNLNLLNYNQSLITLLAIKPGTNMEYFLGRILRKQDLLENFLSVIKTGENKCLLLEWNIRKLKLTLSPIKNNQGVITGIVALIQDISESERLEQMRKDFVANVSHELRTPLTLIKGSIETLIDGMATEPGEIQRQYQRILKETDGLERLVQDLMDLGRLQSGKFSLDFDHIDLKSLVLDVVNSFKNIVQKKGIEIIFEAPENTPLVYGDYGRLKQLLLIFLDNAMKYSNENTKINVSMEVKDYLYVKIKDNGIGIPSEDIPFVWERFYKVDKARSNPQFGTGLGLSIAKYLIEAHHGVVELDSELNKGTTIIIGFPYLKD